jgi:hypothetical protein
LLAVLGNSLAVNFGRKNRLILCNICSVVVGVCNGHFLLVFFITCTICLFVKDKVGTGTQYRYRAHLSSLF